MASRNSSARNLGQVAFVFVVLFVATATMLAVATAQPEETRYVGVIAITADTFTDLGGGLTQAQGNLRLGDHLYLTGAGDTVIFDSSVVTGTGTLALGAGTDEMSLFTGGFRAVGATGIATPDVGVAYELTHVAGFTTTAALTIAQIGIPPAVVTGTAGLHLTPPGVDASATADFTIAPGPTWAGTLAAFELGTAGVTLQAPAGASLTDGDIHAPTITLVLPAHLGGASATVNDLHVGPDSLSLGSAGVAFSLPDLRFGDGSQLRFTDNLALFEYDSAAAAYRLTVTNTLSVTLPENSFTTPTTVTLAHVGGQSQLSGSLDHLGLAVAGCTLTMTQVTAGNGGLHADAATLQLPPRLGRSQASVYHVDVTGDGLSISGGTVRFPLPAVRIGDGNEVALRNGTALLAVEGGAYRLDASADLVLSLPANSQTIAAAFHVQSGDISGTLDAVHLSVAGCTLTMTQVTLSHVGLHTDAALLRLPPALGSFSSTVANVQVGDAGLIFDQADAEFDLPDVVFVGGEATLSFREVREKRGAGVESGLTPPRLSLTDNRAILAILGDGSGYTFHVTGTLRINLPGNAQPPRAFVFDLAHSAGDGYRLQGQLDALTLTVAGATLDLTNLTLGNDGFGAQTAGLTMPSHLGGGVVSLHDVSITGDGLQIGSGTFGLPNVTLAGGKLGIQSAHAGLQVMDDAYHLIAQGTLAITLPENAQTIGLAFGLDGGGNLTGTLSQVALHVAGTGLTMTQVSLGNHGLTTTNALLRLPAGLGGPAIVVNDVRVTDAGLTFGQAGLNVTLPDFAFGGHISFTQNAATLSIADTGQGDQYLFAAHSHLLVDLPDNEQAQDVDFALSRGVGGDYVLSGTVSGLTLTVAGPTLVMQDIAIVNDGLRVATADLRMPPGLGGGTVVVTDVGVTSAGLTLGAADAEIALPDIAFGGGTAERDRVRIKGLAALAPHPGPLPDGERVQFTPLPDRARGKGEGKVAPLTLRNNRARLHIEGDSYIFQVDSTLDVSLPGNVQTSAFSFQMRKDGDGYRLSGTLDHLALNDIAGCSLAMTDMELDNEGLSVASATLTLPPSIGASATVNDVRITGDGLRIGGGSFSLPDITFGGDGSQLKVVSTTVALEISGDDYVLTGTGKLILRLPSDNAHDADIGFTIRRSQFDARLSSLDLAVAGADLALQDIDIDNDGLHVDSATITLPDSLGHASGTLRDVNITEDGLRIGGGSFSLPDIKLGDGSRFQIGDLTAELAVQGNDYTLATTGTIHLDLPGNQQDIQASFLIDSTGEMRGHLDQVTLAVAGATLTMTQVTLDNSGLAVAVAALQLPPSLGSTVGTVDDVRITSDGLHISGGSVSLPDIKIGDGSKVKVNHPTASFSAGAAGYTFALTGTLQLRLPQNSQDIPFHATIDTQGHIQGSVDELSLSLASLNLRLANVSFTNSGLAVAKGTLDLSRIGGSAAFQVDNVTIDRAGLHIGGAGGTFTINEEIRLGSSAGFRVRLQQGTLQIADDRTYKLTLVGMVQIDVPGNSGVQASGTLSLDSQGHFGGSVQKFTLTVAGLSLAVDDVVIDGDTLKVASARLQAPQEWGGAEAALYNVTLSKSHGIQIGGGSFTLPTVKAGGFTVSAHGALKPDGDGYLIEASGTFGVPGLGSSGSCALLVDVTLQSHGQTTVLTLSPPGADTIAAWRARHIPQTPDQPGGLYLKQVHVRLNCTIPIGNTGFALTRAEGTVTLAQGSTTVKLGVTVESTSLRVAGYSALRGDVDMTMCTSPAEFGLVGSLYVFAYHAGQLEVSIKESDGFRGTLWIEAIVARGRFSIHAWSQYGRFHLTGSAKVQIGIPKGAVWSGSIPYPCCTCKWYKCWKKSCWDICHKHINVPPDDWILGDIGVEFGEFSVSGGGTVYGFKGYVDVMGYHAGVFVNDRGSLYVGNVDKYHLVDSLQVAAAQRTWREQGRYGESPATEPFTFLASGEVLVNVPVTATTDLIFALSRDADAPVLSLVRPDGLVITPGNLPANVQYLETVSRTVAVPWQTALAAECLLCQRTTSPGDASTLVAGLGPRELGAGIEEGSPAADGSSGVRAFNAAPDVLAADGSRAIDVLVDDVQVFSHVPYTDALYAALEPGPHTLKVLPAGMAGPALVTTTLDVVTDTHYTVVVLGQQPTVETVTLVDADEPALTGTARLRFVHASSDAPALDVAVSGGLVLFADVPYQGATGYLDLPAGVYDLELRAAGTTNVLASAPGEELRDGSVYTLLACGLASGSPALEAEPLTDVYAYPVTQTLYVIQQAQTGTWQARLSGETSPDDQYSLAVLGSNPPPVLSDVNVVKPDPETALVTWRLTSDEPDTTVDIYVVQGTLPPTYTHVITQTNGVTATQVLTLYIGTALARDLASATDGTLQTHALSLGQLESGTYRVWLKAEDTRNPPVQVYAPVPIVVEHPASSWDAYAGWDARIQATPDYRQLDVQWNRCGHPDTDGYVLYVGTRAITMGNATSALVTALQPGQAYELSVRACDEDAGRAALSRRVTATTRVADFAVTAPITVHITGGYTAQVVLTLTTALDPYSDSVGLYAGCIRSSAPLPFVAYLPLAMKDAGPVASLSRAVPLTSEDAACRRVDGIGMSLDPRVVTPTVAGVPVTVLISTTHSLPGGEYAVPIIAHGGGVTHTAELRVHVWEPRFTLASPTNVATVSWGQAAGITISATGIHGEGDAIYLDLKGVPPGLGWAFGNGEKVAPGSSVTLTLTDTHMLGHGEYPLQIVGEDGENTEVFSLTLQVLEPGFEVAAATPRVRVEAGQVAVFPLDISAENGWSAPMTLTLDAQTIPARTLVGFLEQSPAAFGGEAEQTVQVQAIVTPPARVFLAVVTQPDTPAGLYLIRALGEGVGQGGGNTLQRSVQVGLEVYEKPRLYLIYLPLTSRE